MILLSAGHYPEAPGACWPEGDRDWCEHALATEWCAIIAERVSTFEPCALVPTGKLESKVAWINSQRPVADLVAELHFNAGVPRARGTETLYCPGSLRGRLAAGVVQRHIAAVLPPDRGVKEGWYRMDKPGVKEWEGDVEGDEVVDYFLRATDPVALILEPEFIHNKVTLLAQRDAACEAIAAGLVAALVALRRPRNGNGDQQQ